MLSRYLLYNKYVHINLLYFYLGNVLDKTSFGPIGLDDVCTKI